MFEICWLLIDNRCISMYFFQHNFTTTTTFSPHPWKEHRVMTEFETLCWILPRWRHQTEIFSALLAICAGNSPVIGEFPVQRPVARSFDVFLICSGINSRVNNRDTGDLRRHRAHYDVTIMSQSVCPLMPLNSFSKTKLRFPKWWARSGEMPLHSERQRGLIR